MATCRNLFILLAILFITYPVSTQIRSDFVVADSGTTPSFDFDDNGNIHLVWTSERSEDFSTMYCVMDSLGKLKYEPRRISESPATRDPKVEVNNDKVACIWEDLHSLHITFFKTWIHAKILKDGLDFSPEVEIDDGDIYPTDAMRFHPKIVWQSDSILYTVWDGSGIQSKADDQDIYAEKLLMPLQKFGDNYTINNTSLRVGEIYPSVIKSQTGDTYLVVWAEKDSVGVMKIAARSLSADFKPLTTEIILVDLDTTAYISHPSVLRRGNGNMIVVWEKDTANYKSNIFMREFTIDGIPIGDARKLNDKLANSGSEVSADVDENDNLIVAWEEGNRIAAQRYNYALSTIGANFYLQTQLGSTNIYPNVKLRNHKIYTIWAQFHTDYANIAMSIYDFDDPVSVHQDPALEPTEFKLSQNWPNPFNPVTTISFNLPSRLQVSLRVYDLLGRELSTIVSEILPPGNYSYQWEPRGLSSGIYFYRIQAGRFVDTKRLSFIK